MHKLKPCTKKEKASDRLTEDKDYYNLEVDDNAYTKQMNATTDLEGRVQAIIGSLVDWCRFRRIGLQEKNGCLCITLSHAPKCFRSVNLLCSKHKGK